MENEEAAIKLADQLVSCSLPDPTDKPLHDIVNDVQRHKHTKSCLKYNGKCRYGFPKLPSPKTLIAKPLEMTDPNMDVKDKKKLKERVAEVMEAAQKYLEDPEFNENMSIEDFCKAIEVECFVKKYAQDIYQ